MTEQHQADRPGEPVGPSVSGPPSDGAPASGRQRRAVATFAVVVALVVGGLALLGQLLSSGEVACDPIPGVRPGVCITPVDQRGAAPTQPAPLVGGGEASVADFRGQVLVVNFWAAWCGPCRAEQPLLNEAHELLAGDDIAFLGVAIQDSEVNQQAHVDEFAIPYASIFDPSNAYAATYGGIGARSIPTTIILDRQGRVAVRLFGEVVGIEELAALTARIAGEAETSAAG